MEAETISERTACFIAVLAIVGAWISAAQAQSIEALRQLSIEDLANIEVTSVSKRPEALSAAPAAVYVITGEDIRASGAVSLPEALRLAPNLEVARIDSQTYTISARGFNSANASDKLLVLVDGRTIYSPFFHNVQWDQHDVLLDDVERIEVISGPGGTLWGANAVNGVINIITKHSRDTQGGLVDLNYGNFDRGGAGRWGGKFGPNGTYRVYALGFGRDQTDIAGTRTGARDSWTGYRAGFRSDWAGERDGVTLQGDVFENPFDVGGRSNGGNLLGRWTRQLGNGSMLELQSYYDRSDEQPADSVRDNVDTFDLQLQHSIPLGERQQLVWGVGQRVWTDRFTPINAALIVPSNQTLALTNVFAEDTIRLFDTLSLTVGSKVEYNTFSGVEPLPNARLAWQVAPTDLIWAAVSRAAETPSRLDRNLVIAPFFGPSPQFQSEQLIAYETGYRTQFSTRASLSVSLFYNEYSDIRTTSLNPAGVPLALFRNDLAGHTYGAELWGDVRPFSWWRLTAGVDLLRKSLHLKPGGSDIAGPQTAAGIDPGHQVFLRSFVHLTDDVDFYVGLRQVGSLPLANVPSYFEADARVGWQVTPSLEVFVSGQNLVHAKHVEATNGFGVNFAVPRTGLVGLRRSF